MRAARTSTKIVLLLLLLLLPLLLLQQCCIRACSQAGADDLDAVGSAFMLLEAISKCIARVPDFIPFDTIYCVCKHVLERVHTLCNLSLQVLPLLASMWLIFH